MRNTRPTRCYGSSVVKVFDSFRFRKLKKKKSHVYMGYIQYREKNAKTCCPTHTQFFNA